MDKIKTNATKAQTWVVNAVFGRTVDPQAPDLREIPDHILWEMHCTVDEHGNLEPDQNTTDVALFLYINARLVEENYPQKLTLDLDKVTNAIEQFSILVAMEKLWRMGLVEYQADSSAWIDGRIIIDIKNILSVEELIRNQPLS